MDKLVYTAASGLKARLGAQAAIANNMANASTTGFRADRAVFDRLQLDGPGFADRAPAGEEVTDCDRTPGTIQQTGRDLDIAVTGDAWIAVQGSDGTEAYTRRGDLEVAPSGVLQTGDGFPVMGSTGPITVIVGSKFTTTVAVKVGETPPSWVKATAVASTAAKTKVPAGGVSAASTKCTNNS